MNNRNVKESQKTKMVIPWNSGIVIYRIDYAGCDNIKVCQCYLENTFGTERGTDVSFNIIPGKKN